MTERDWRLTWEEEWMYGARLERRAFTAPSPDWDHEHCVLCQSKFMEAPHDALREGLVYDRPAPHRSERAGDERWICETCFADFTPRFRWTASHSGDAPHST